MGVSWGSANTVPSAATQTVSTRIHPKRGILVDKTVHESS